MRVPYLADLPKWRSNRRDPFRGRPVRLPEGVAAALIATAAIWTTIL